MFFKSSSIFIDPKSLPPPPNVFCNSSKVNEYMEDCRFNGEFDTICLLPFITRTAALQSGRSRSALVKDPEPPSVPPTKKQVDDLFQWFDDDEVIPPPAVPIPPVNAHAAQVLGKTSRLVKVLLSKSQSTAKQKSKYC
ncbi:hypothetical protein Tco_0897395 [Tanacetum coccineum]